MRLFLKNSLKRFFGWQSLKETLWHGHPARTPTTKLRFGKLRSCWPFTLCQEAPSAKFWRIFSPTRVKNVAKIWRKISPMFVLQFPGEVAARNFTKNWRQIRLVVTPHCKTLGAWGHNLQESRGPPGRASQKKVSKAFQPRVSKKSWKRRRGFPSKGSQLVCAQIRRPSKTSNRQCRANGWLSRTRHLWGEPSSSCKP